MPALTEDAVRQVFVDSSLGDRKSKKGSGEAKTESSHRWQNVSQVYSKLNDTQMDHLNRAILIGENDRRIWETAKKNPKAAAEMTLREHMKWEIQNLKDDLDEVKPFLAKELAMSVKQDMEDVDPGSDSMVEAKSLSSSDKQELESILDRSSPQAMMNALAEVCFEKADHVRSNWQDESLAKVWERCGSMIDRVKLPKVPGFESINHPGEWMGEDEATQAKKLASKLDQSLEKVAKACDSAYVGMDNARGHLSDLEDIQTDLEDDDLVKKIDKVSDAMYDAEDLSDKFLESQDEVRSIINKVKKIKF